MTESPPQPNQFGECSLSIAYCSQGFPIMLEEESDGERSIIAAIKVDDEVCYVAK